MRTLDENVRQAEREELTARRALAWAIRTKAPEDCHGALLEWLSKLDPLDDALARCDRAPSLGPRPEENEARQHDPLECLRFCDRGHGQGRDAHCAGRANHRGSHYCVGHARGAALLWQDP